MQTVLFSLPSAYPRSSTTYSRQASPPSPGINMAPVLLWIPAILYTVALFRYQFLDIVPIARGRLIETLSRPVLVLDPDGRVIDLNPAACSLFSFTSASEALGRKIDETRPGLAGFSVSVQRGHSEQERTRPGQGECHHVIISDPLNRS